MEKQFQVSAFYKFVSIEDIEHLKLELDRYLVETEILGTVLIAKEGVNGTISGPQGEVEAFLGFFARLVGLETLPYKVAFYNSRPFHRMKVRLKKEIVTMGVDGIDPNKEVGTYVFSKGLERTDCS